MAYAPAALRWLATEWEAAIGSAVFSGIVGDAAHTYGYHRAANEIPASDYSRQLVGDRDVDGIDMNAADAIDMNMSRADMMLVTRRVYNSWRDQNDPRLNWWREVIGTLDGSTVIYMDCQSGRQDSADDSHLWHMHAGGLRVHANNMDAMRALLSAIKGETVAQWQAGDDMSWTEATPAIPGETLVTGEYVPATGAKTEAVQTGVALMYALRHAYVARRVAEALYKRPAVQAAPVDPATLKAVLLDPQVLAAIAKAVVDEDHRRSAA